MANETIYQAYFETEKYSVFVEYEPGPNGAIFILSIDIQPRPRSEWELREADPRKYPRRPRRGLVLDEQEERTEAMLPTHRLEQMEFYK